LSHAFQISFFFKGGHGSQDSGVWLGVCMYVFTYVCIYIHVTSSIDMYNTDVGKKFMK
jgi:hypothetical protein